MWTFGHLRVWQRPFCSTPGGAQEDIYVKRVGGGSSEPLLLGGEGNKEPDRWSADGRHVIYDNIGNKATGTDCLGAPDIRRPQSFPVVQTPATDFYGNLSPGGKWAAYESDESGRGEIYVVPFREPGANGRSPPVVVLRPYGRRATNYFMKPPMPSSWLSNSPPLARISSSASLKLLLGGRSLASVNGIDVNRHDKRWLMAMPVGEPNVSPLILTTNWTAMLKP